jgi:hypothetical protein
VKVEIAAPLRWEDERRVESRWEGVEGCERERAERHVPALAILRDTHDLPVFGEAAAHEDEGRCAAALDVYCPTVEAGATCPVTAGGRPNPDVAIALGSGPACPVLGFEGNHAPPDPKAVVPLYGNERKEGAYWHKTLWTVDPRYDGPVLIRARRLDPPQVVQFARPSGTPGTPEEQVGELEFRREKPTPGATALPSRFSPGRGCFAFQVDGSAFSKVIVFAAAEASP